MKKYLIRLNILRRVDHHKAIHHIFSNEELVLDSYEIAEQMNCDQREVRRVLSDLRKEMKVVNFSRRIKGRKGLYVVYDEYNPKHREQFAKIVEQRYKEWNSLYFNNIVKYIPMLKEEKLIHKLKQTQIALERENENNTNY